MKIFRPIQPDDFKALNRLVRRTTYGLTSLPKDKTLLKNRIQDSIHSFTKQSRSPGGETYLFVLEDLNTGKIAGVSGIVSKVGGFEPWYTYKIISTLHASELLKVRKEVEALHLVADHNGPCEIGSLFLAPAYRKKGMGRFLSLARFLFMADHKKLFDPTVIAEMRGVINTRGHSPFWDSLGKHFFDIDFPRADYLSMVNKKFIADLMPTHPIYIPLLPGKAQRVIGKVHPRTGPALAILQKEGFQDTDMVDVFEAGPVVTCKLNRIRSVKESIKGKVHGITDDVLIGPDYLISNTLFQFRACLGTLKFQGAGKKIVIHRKTALALKLKLGDPVRFVRFRPKHSR